MELLDKRTLVLGASLKPERYSNMAIKSLCNHGYTVLAHGLRKGTAHCIEVDNEKKQYDDVDTITIYLGEKNQLDFEEYILGLKPKRIIFNPGAENPSFSKSCQDKGIECLNACTLVMLNTGQY